MTVFSKNLKRFRVAKNMTQEQAAEALGVSTQTVSRWECNTTLPDVTILPKIAALYCVTIDDLYKETSMAYDNYAQRLGSVFEASLKPEDFLRADMEYQKLLKSEEYTTEDLRLYGILYQEMMCVCIKKAGEMFDRVLKKGPTEDSETYWRTQRQKAYFLWEIGRNQENIEEFLPLVEAGSNELQEWVCLIQAYSFAGDYDAAWKWVQKAEAKFPESATLHIYTGNLLRSMKRYDEAFPHWKRALEMEPQWCDAAYSMASCYEEIGDYINAYAVYNQIADNLESRGFEAEVNWPRSLAHKCREKITT
ncbi:MAG: helix-turn-helix domain-containing protein [Eubacteriales bacterium]|nr:helix-turn-helix domain-containing protein [Eubacteriales bacterium]